jgi:hypothetical protein
VEGDGKNRVRKKVAYIPRFMLRYWIISFIVLFLAFNMQDLIQDQA